MYCKIFCATAALLLAFGTPAATAAEILPSTALITQALYPVDVQVDADQLTLKKIYDVDKTIAPDQIPQDSFDRGDLHYDIRDLLRIELPSVDRKMHTETVTISSTSNRSDDVLSLFPESKEIQTADGYTGTAYLDTGSISTQSAGTRTVTTPLSSTRTYPNLPDMDLSTIPKTITENGKTLAFSDISWKTNEEEVDNLGTVQTTYTATVKYSGEAYHRENTGYTLTATYSGEVTRPNNSHVRYIAVYHGTPLAMLQAAKQPVLTTGAAASGTGQQHNRWMDILLLLMVLIAWDAVSRCAFPVLRQLFKDRASHRQMRLCAQQPRLRAEQQHRAKTRETAKSRFCTPEFDAFFGAPVVTPQVDTDDAENVFDWNTQTPTETPTVLQAETDTTMPCTAPPSSLCEQSADERTPIDTPAPQEQQDQTNPKGDNPNEQNDLQQPRSSPPTAPPKRRWFARKHKTTQATVHAAAPPPEQESKKNTDDPVPDELHRFAPEPEPQAPAGMEDWDDWLDDDDDDFPGISD